MQQLKVEGETAGLAKTDNVCQMMHELAVAITIGLRNLTW